MKTIGKDREETDHREDREALCVVFEVKIEDVEKEKIHKSELQQGNQKHRTRRLMRSRSRSKEREIKSEKGRGGLTEFPTTNFPPPKDPPLSRRILSNFENH